MEEIRSGQPKTGTPVGSSLTRTLEQSLPTLPTGIMEDQGGGEEREYMYNVYTVVDNIHVL